MTDLLRQIPFEYLVAGVIAAMTIGIPAFLVVWDRVPRRTRKEFRVVNSRTGLVVFTTRNPQTARRNVENLNDQYRGFRNPRPYRLEGVTR